MSESARVESLDALKEFKADLVTFGVDVQEALATAQVAIQRVVDGLHQQLMHWQAEIRHRQEDLVRAKSALSQKRWGHSEGRGSGMSEAEAAVRLAERRLREAEEKVQTCKRWLLHLPREIGEYDGPAQRLGGWIEADLKQGTALLQRRIASLEDYLRPTNPPDNGGVS